MTLLQASSIDDSRGFALSQSFNTSDLIEMHHGERNQGRIVENHSTNATKRVLFFSTTFYYRCLQRSIETRSRGGPLVSVLGPLYSLRY